MNEVGVTRKFLTTYRTTIYILFIGIACKIHRQIKTVNIHFQKTVKRIISFSINESSTS